MHKGFNSFLASNELSLNRDIASSTGNFAFSRQDQHSDYMFWYIPLVEKDILKLSKCEYRHIKAESLSDSIQNIEDSITICAARVYFELRNCNLNMAKTGKVYHSSSVKHLNDLWNMQMRCLLLYMNNLDSLFKNDETLVRESLRTWVLKRTDAKDRRSKGERVGRMMRALTRALYLEMLQDCIDKQHAAEILSFDQNWMEPFFFVINGVHEMNLSRGLSINVNLGNLSLANNLLTTDDDLRDNKLDAWYAMFIGLFADAMTFGTEEYRLDLQKYPDLLNQYSSKIDQAGSVEEKVKIYNQFKQHAGSMLNLFKRAKYNAADRFTVLKDVVLNKLLGYVESNPQFEYNSQLIQVCQYLFLTGVYRRYDMSGDLEKIKKADDKRFELYNGLRKEEENINAAIEKCEKKLEEKVNASYSQYLKTKALNDKWIKELNTFIENIKKESKSK